MTEPIQELKLLVPTYNGTLYPDLPEFSEECVPVLVAPSEGVRIVLGTHDLQDYDKPDILIERRPHGWVIFLHPVGGCDPVGCLHFHDDGRCFLQSDYEYVGGPEPPVILGPGDKVPGFDFIEEVEPEATHYNYYRCDKCTREWLDSGPEYNPLPCPHCGEKACLPYKSEAYLGSEETQPNV